MGIIGAKKENGTLSLRRGRARVQGSILEGLRAVLRGEFDVRLARTDDGVDGEIAQAFNDLVELNQRTSRELRRLTGVVARQGRIGDRVEIPGVSGEWARNLESINELIDQFHDLDRQRDEFLAAISHDLRTPVAIIRGRANLLQRVVGRADGPNIPELATGLQTIDDSTVRLARLIDELLDLMRLRSGHAVDFDLAPTDLIAVTRRLAAEYEATHPDQPIRIETELGSLTGNWDTARIDRVVSNLLSNAVKYGDQGREITLIATRQAEHDGERAVLAVRNHGPGIPPAELERIFEAYYRGSNVGETISGAGVGLTGARHIVEQHGGTIDVESVLGDTTTFTVRLPMDGGLTERRV